MDYNSDGSWNKFFALKELIKQASKKDWQTSNIRYPNDIMVGGVCRMINALFLQRFTIYDGYLLQKHYENFLESLKTIVSCE